MHRPTLQIIINAEGEEYVTLELDGTTWRDNDGEFVATNPTLGKAIVSLVEEAAEWARKEAASRNRAAHFQRLPCGCPIDSGCTGHHGGA